MIEIKKIETRRQLNKFIKFPWSLYKHIPQWVPPIISDQKEFFDRSKNSFFTHSEADLFLAFKDGKLVGRISAAKSSVHLRIHSDETAFFGFFECIDDTRVSDALLKTASDWAVKRDLKYLRGPLSFTMNDETGLLIEGFDNQPCVGMPYHLPYYGNLIESFGFKKSQDLFAYKADLTNPIPERIEKGIALILDQPELELRKMDSNRMDEEIDILGSIYHEAWIGNWGAVPIDKDEFKVHAKKMKLFLNFDLIYGAYYNGKPVGYSLAVPDFNQVLKLANGRLLPLGIIKIMMNKKHINGIRLLLSGVLKEFHRTGIEAALLYKTWEQARKYGYQWAELSWILESNTAANEAISNFGMAINTRYRLYDKKI
jgi:GNAT superfamily N-acetyltransferase